MATSKKCLRILLLVYVALLAVFSFAALVCDSVLLYRVLKYDRFVHSDAIVIISLSIVLCVITCGSCKLGWSFVYKQNRIRILAFTVLLVMLAACGFGLFVWTLTVMHRLRDSVTSGIETSFSSATVDKDEASAKLWDTIQTELLCCGMGGPTDYRSSRSVPWSCCIRPEAEAVHSGDCSSVHQRGCLLNLFDELHDQLLYTALVVLTITAIQFLGVVGFYTMSKRLAGSSREETRAPAGSEGVTRGLINSSSRPPKY